MSDKLYWQWHEEEAKAECLDLRVRVREVEAENKALKEAAMIYATNAGHSKSCLKVRLQHSSASTVDKEICVCGHRYLVDTLQDEKE